MTKKLVQFLIVTDGKLEMTRNDTSLLVITSSITSQLENFSGEVLKNSGEIDGSTSTNTRSKLDFQVHKIAIKKLDRRQTVERSFPSSKDDEHDRRGKRDRP